MTKKTEKSSEHIVKITNKLNPGFRQIHVDGALGALTPRGLINLNFFAERLPVPKSTEFKIDQEAKRMDKVKDSDDSLTGIVREYEFGIYMTPETTLSVISFLQMKLTELETIKGKE